MSLEMHKQGFHLGLWLIQNPLLILCYQVCVEVSLLCSLPTTVCVTVSSVVHQVALFLQWSVQQQIVLTIRLLCSLPIIVCAVIGNVVYQVTLFPFYTGSLQYCVSDHSAPFLQWSVQLWIMLSNQVTLLPSSNSKATASSSCSLPVPILF